MAEAPPPSLPGEPPTTPPAAPPVGAPPAVPPWHASFDDDTKGWLGKNGIDKLDAPGALAELTKGFRNAEKFIGAPPESILRLPADDKPESWKPVWAKLGVPETADAYKIPVPDGHDPAFSKAVAPLFHKANLTAKQAETLATEWNAMQAAAATEQQTAYAAQIETETTALRKEWGAAYDQEIDLAKRAAGEFGFTTEELAKIEATVGFSGLLKRFNKIGKSLGEAAFDSGDKNAGGFGTVMTPEAAKMEITQLRNDTVFTKKLMDKDVESVRRWEQLHKWAAPEAKSGG